MKTTDRAISMTFPKWQSYKKSTPRVDYPKNWKLIEIYAQLLDGTFDPKSVNRCLWKNGQSTDVHEQMNRSQTSIFSTLILCNKICRTEKSQIQWDLKSDHLKSGNIWNLIFLGTTSFFRTNILRMQLYRTRTNPDRSIELYTLATYTHSPNSS